MGCLPLVLGVLGLGLASLVTVLAVTGPRDAVWLTGAVLLLQQVGAAAVLIAVGWTVMPAVGIVAGLSRRGPPDGDGGPTGPLLVWSGVAAYAALALVACLPAWLVDLPVRWWMPAGPAVVLLCALVARAVLGRRARPHAV